MSVVVVIVLHQFLVLKMSILLLDCVQLVSQCNIVLVPLLDLKYFSLELADEEVLLITGEMNRIVILEKCEQRNDLLLP